MSRIETPVRPDGIIEHITPQQALAPVRETTRDKNILRLLQKDPSHAVVYISVLSENADTEKLIAQDKLAFEEANNSGGLLIYEAGPIHATSKTEEKMSTERADMDDVFSRPEVIVNFCFWESEADATKAFSKEQHGEAMKMAIDSYDEYNVFVYDVAREKDELVFMPKRQKYYNAADHAEDTVNVS